MDAGVEYEDGGSIGCVTGADSLGIFASGSVASAIYKLA